MPDPTQNRDIHPRGQRGAELSQKLIPHPGTRTPLLDLKKHGYIPTQPRKFVHFPSTNKILPGSQILNRLHSHTVAFYVSRGSSQLSRSFAYL